MGVQLAWVGKKKMITQKLIINWLQVGDEIKRKKNTKKNRKRANHKRKEPKEETTNAIRKENSTMYTIACIF